MNKILSRDPQLRYLLHTVSSYSFAITNKQLSLFLQAKLPPNIPNNDQLVKWHHKAIGEMLDSVIRNIDCMNESIDELRSVGAAHAQFYDDGMKVCIQPNSNVTSLFAVAFLDNICRSVYRNDNGMG